MEVEVAATSCMNNVKTYINIYLPNNPIQTTSMNTRHLISKYSTAWIRRYL